MSPDGAADAIVQTGSTIDYPPMTEHLHFKCKPAVVLGKGGRDIRESDALDHIDCLPDIEITVR